MDALAAGVDSPTPSPLLGVVGLLLSVAAGSSRPIGQTTVWTRLRPARNSVVAASAAAVAAAVVIGWAL